MRFAVFRLTVSSSWGNGHATLWRALATALGRLGHRLDFYEKDEAWYASHRDLRELPAGRLVLYDRFENVRAAAEEALASTDVAVVTSYCPDALAATDLVLAASRPLKVFYDLDTGVTIARLRAGERAPWIGERGLRGFDLVLSFTGGRTLSLLRNALGARRAAPLYGSVDPAVHRPLSPVPEFRGDLSYLGTYAASRQRALETLFVEPARRLPERTFVVAGSMYDGTFPWRDNIRWVRHLEPALHPTFFRSSPLTVNVTRPEMAELGHCPSGRLFEAAACGVPVLSDWFDGLDAFFEPGEEILVARTADEAIRAVTLPREVLARIGRRARQRTLAEHGAATRARQLVTLCEATRNASGRRDAGREPSAMRPPTIADDRRDGRHATAQGSSARRPTTATPSSSPGHEDGPHHGLDSDHGGTR